MEKENKQNDNLSKETKSPIQSPTLHTGETLEISPEELKLIAKEYALDEKPQDDPTTPSSDNDS